MPTQRYSRDKNVLEAARERIAFVFEHYEDIIVSISGGKDSTVLAHLALSEAHKRERRIGVHFLDEEVVYQSSVDQVDAWPPYPFKYLGNACDDWDEVYTRQESLFCDSSGWGAPGEPALTADQLRERLHELVQEHGVIYVAIEEMGQFQLHLAVWAE